MKKKKKKKSEGFAELIRVGRIPKQNELNVFFLFFLFILEVVYTHIAMAIVITNGSVHAYSISRVAHTVSKRL